MKHLHYYDYALILAKDNYQNYLILMDHAEKCIIIGTDLPEDNINEIKWKFEADTLTYDEFNYDGLPFTDLTSFNTWKVIA